jgi:hypothetical protein
VIGYVPYSKRAIYMRKLTGFPPSGYSVVELGGVERKNRLPSQQFLSTPRALLASLAFATRLQSPFCLLMHHPPLLTGVVPTIPYSTASQGNGEGNGCWCEKREIRSCTEVTTSRKTPTRNLDIASSMSGQRLRRRLVALASSQRWRCRWAVLSREQ